MRLELWHIALREYCEHPLLGSGPDTFEVYFRQYRTQTAVEAYGKNVQSHAHNFVLDSLGTTGLLGTVILLWGLSRLFGPRTPERAGLIALGVVALVDPLPLEVLCLGAVLAARCYTRLTWDTATRAMACVIGVAGVSVSLGLAYLELRPINHCEPRAQAERLRLMPAVFMKAKDPEDGASLMRREYLFAEAAVRCRPNYAPTLMLAGLVDDYMASVGVEGMREKAAEKYSRARQLDPLGVARP